jgi:hypothetical protein
VRREDDAKLPGGDLRRVQEGVKLGVAHRRQLR